MVNWDAVGAVGEILGAIAVVASLIYVAKQVQSNTKAQKAAAGFDISTKMSDLNLTLTQCMMTDPNYLKGEESRITHLVNVAYGVDSKPEDLTPSDHLTLAFINRALFQRIEGEYFLYEHGFLDQSQWNGRKAWACGYLELPLIKNWWEFESTQEVFRPEFVAALKSARATWVRSPTVIQESPANSPLKSKGKESHDAP